MIDQYDVTISRNGDFIATIPASVDWSAPRFDWDDAPSAVGIADDDASAVAKAIESGIVRDTLPDGLRFIARFTGSI